MLSIIRYTLLTALRDLLFAGLFIFILGAIGIAFMLGSTALVEQQQMILAYIAGAVRVILITGNILFICFHVRRSFENKEIDLTLSRPISRTAFTCAYWFGFTLLSFIIAIPAIGIIALTTHANSWGLAYWGFSLLCETALVSAFALVSALIMQSAVTSALSALGFYLLARMMGFFIVMIQAMGNNVEPNLISKLMWVLGQALFYVSTAFPRLDLFGKTSWLTYGVHDVSHLWIVPLQSLIFIPLLLSIAIFDFKRKQF